MTDRAGRIKVTMSCNRCGIDGQVLWLPGRGKDELLDPFVGRVAWAVTSGHWVLSCGLCQNNRVFFHVGPEDTIYKGDK